MATGATEAEKAGGEEEAGPAAALALPNGAGSCAGVAPTRHELQHTWCLWVLLHSRQGTKDNWRNSQMNVHAFSTVEDFWRLFNNIQTPSKLGIIDFSVFKKDIVPAWEDPTCQRGGRWLAKIDRMKGTDLDELWLNLVLTLIGENLHGVGGGAICGAVLSQRAGKNSKMALWVAERSKEKIMPLGRAFYKLLQDATFAGEITFDDFSDKTRCVTIPERPAEKRASAAAPEKPAAAAATTAAAPESGAAAG